MTQAIFGGAAGMASNISQTIGGAVTTGVLRGGG